MVPHSKDHISEETYEKFSPQVCEMHGIPSELFEGFKPWVIGITLETFFATDLENIDEIAPSANYGIDLYFMSHAQLIDMPIVELEGLEFRGQLI